MRCGWWAGQRHARRRSEGREGNEGKGGARIGRAAAMMMVDGVGVGVG